MITPFAGFLFIDEFHHVHLYSFISTSMPVTDPTLEDSAADIVDYFLNRFFSTAHNNFKYSTQCLFGKYSQIFCNFIWNDNLDATKTLYIPHMEAARSSEGGKNWVLDRPPCSFSDVSQDWRKLLLPVRKPLFALCSSSQITRVCF